MEQEKQKELEFTGVANANPDNVSNNGEVAMAFGLTSQGTLSTPTSPKKVHLYHVDGCDTICIHKGSGFENVFVYDPAKDEVRAYKYDELQEEGGEPTVLATVSGKPTSACMLGNVVVLTFSDKQRYLYRDGEVYDEKDNNLPSFYMDIKAAVRVGFYSENKKTKLNNANHKLGADGIYGLYYGGDKYSESEKDTKGSNYIPSARQRPSSVHAQMEYHEGRFNSLVKEWGEVGYLFSPVLVRACYKLKTGDISGLTPPILCMPFGTPLIASNNMKLTDANDVTHWYNYTRGIAYKLFGKFHELQEADFETYGNIIESIDIYMTPPIYTYSVEPLDLIGNGSLDGKSQGDLNGFNADIADFEGVLRMSINQEFSEGDTLDIFNRVQPGPKINSLSVNTLEGKISFYKVRSLPYQKSEFFNLPTSEDSDYYQKEIYAYFTDGELQGYRKLLDRDEEQDIDVSVTTDSIVTRELMEDFLYSGSDIDYPQKSYVYNQRLLNIGRTVGQKKCYVPLFKGIVVIKQYDLSIDFSGGGEGGRVGTKKELYNDFSSVPSIPKRNDLSDTAPNGFYNNVGYGVIKNTDGTRKVMAVDLTGMVGIPMYLAFREMNLQYILAQGGNFDGARANGNYVKIYFGEHANLNLSYYKGVVNEYTSESEGYAEVAKEYAELAAAVAAGDELTKQVTTNYIRASNVGDPYTFEDSNTAYFNSEVKEVMVVPEAISLGQYGTSQLYVLCEDGIYTVAVSDGGKLQSVSTYSQERPLHPERSTIYKTQLVTNNGREWGAYSGQRKEDLLSLMRNLAFAFDELPHISNKLVSGQYSELVKGTTLYDFLCNANLTYDGHNDQLVAYADGYDCIAVWKQGHGLHLLPVEATHKVEAARLVLGDGKQNLYDFAEADVLADTEGFLVSRPIHLGDDINTPCTVRKIIVRGDFDYCTASIKLVLYGTRDYRTWHLVTSSSTYYIAGISGSGYKAFKVVVIAKLGRHEYISHLSIRYVEKPTKNMSF